jgi:MFS family permease
MKPRDDEIAPPARFRGWQVVAAAFTGQLIANGGTFAAFGVLVVPLADTFGASRGAVSSGAGLGMLVMGLSGPFLGRVLDGGNVRRMMLFGVVLMSVGLLLLSQATSLWQAGACYALAVSAGAAMFGPIPSVTLAGNWFIRRRGLALGITVAGATCASFIAPALLAWLTELYGWRTAVASFGVGTFVIAAPIVWALVVARPEDVGQRPDGDAATAGSDPAGDSVVVPETRDLLRQPNLWIQAMGFAFLFASPVVMSLHLIPFAEDQGFGRLHGAYFFTAMAPFSLLGKVAFGAIADRVDIRRAIWAIIGGLIVTWVLLLGGPSYRMLLFIGAVFGLAVGAVGPVHGVLVGKCFGRGAFGRVMGMGGLASLPIIASAGPVAGYLFDVTGSYQTSFQLQVGGLVMAAVIFLFLRVPEVEPGTENTTEEVASGDAMLSR